MSGSAGRGIFNPGAESLSVRELAEWAPRLHAVLRELGVAVGDHDEASLAFLCEEAGLRPQDVFDALAEDGGQATPHARVQRLTIIGGRDKEGRPEPVQRLEIEAGQVVALVGVTGSGKSQVLTDVESLASGDSPSGRVVLLDGAAPAEEVRWSPASRPVAQVSQGMQFLLDVTVAEFLEMHVTVRAGSCDDHDESLIREVVDAGCALCGEPFDRSTTLSSLSGGQSRALMIADAALISRAPILLIDEIENAGIDRRRALEFLVGQRTIALISTHDPLLALSARRRVLLRRGAMQEIRVRTAQELDLLAWLERRDHEQARLRDALRTGAPLEGQQLGLPGLSAGGDVVD